MLHLASEMFGLQIEDLVEAYANLPYAIRLEADVAGDNPCVMAYNPELPGCMAQGDTALEAVDNLKEARQDYIADLLQRDLDFPKPGIKSEIVQMTETAIVYGINYGANLAVPVSHWNDNSTITSYDATVLQAPFCVAG